MCDAVFFVYFISERQSYTWIKGRAFENWIILLFCDTFLFKVSRGEYEVSGGNNPIQNYMDTMDTYCIILLSQEQRQC